MSQLKKYAKQISWKAKSRACLYVTFFFVKRDIGSDFILHVRGDVMMFIKTYMMVLY